MKFITVFWEMPGLEPEDSRMLILPIASITAVYVGKDYDTIIECGAKRYHVTEPIDQIERMLKPLKVERIENEDNR